MKNVKNNNGITLMALVITIIILIILASIGTYSGIQVVKSAQFTAFSTELKIMQTQVNKLYEEKKNGNSDVDALGKTISSSSTTVQSHATKAFNASGITDTSDYKYFDTDTIKSLNIEGVEGEFFVNIDKRSVVSYDGFKYEGTTYYTLNQLPDSLYNVEYNQSTNVWDSSKDSFNVEYNKIEDNKYKMTVSDINYQSGNINKWQVKYKKENEDDWKTSNSNSFIIDELGNYRVKITNNNTESREKQIMAKTLPSEYQQVEYIESTGTQYIDTGVIPKATLNGEFDLMSIDGGYPFGSTNGQNIDYWGMNFNKGNGTFQLYFGTGSYPLVSSWQINMRYKISIINKKFYCDNNFLYDFSQTSNGFNFNTNKSIYLFGLNYNGVAYSKFRFYAAKFYDDNVLIRNFIPCYRKSDIKPGLYDMVNGVFYTNQGTGEFGFPIERYPLPSQYQQVEYIESTGTQYIDTGVIPKATLNGEFDLMSIDGGYPFGSTNGQNIDYWGMNFNKGNGTFQLYFGTGSYPLVSSWQINMRYKISIINKKFYCDNNFLYDFSQTSNGFNFNTNKSIYLFGLNYNGVAYSKFRFYAAKFYDDNVLIRNFIPCYRRSDNKPGLYDLVNNEFYTNQGTGDFIKGDDVIASDNTNDGMIIIINNM